MARDGGNGGGGGGFQRDLGYLDAFLNKLEAHAREMGGPSGGRLGSLIDEERGRWREIRALLDGNAPVAESRGSAGPVVTDKGTPGFTVGSLVNRRE